MRQTTKGNTTDDDFLIPWYVVSVTAIICAIALVLIAVLGPAILGVIRYRTSQSGIWQTQAFDITGLIVLAPLLLIGGVLPATEEGRREVFSGADANHFDVCWLGIWLRPGMGQHSLHGQF
jgi:hypothetical protein